MVVFRTEINPVPAPRKIHYLDPVCSIGSCFAVHIGQYLLDNKFDAMTNPYGIVYNPVSLFDLILKTVRKEPPAPDGFLVNQGVARHYDLHSDISADTSENLLLQYHTALHAFREHLQRTRFMIITLGTAWVYRHLELDRIVNNCHKMPARLFDRFVLQPEEIEAHFDRMHTELLRLNPGVRIILTVSPVRHLRDTLPGSQLSKSVLRVVCNTLENRYEHVFYFPSYELLVDDLRDYRFYERDLLHPNEIAREYIWNKFAQTCFDEETLGFLEAWTAIRKRIRHKPFNPGSLQHREFILQTIDMLRSFTYTVDTTSEIKTLESQLHG